ncbi:ArsC family reductase [Chitinilyticum piscinae]|uniref:ArsC family reductase n=1 Tax=Chitinilyticum piscinae TaxID=2866724 RepID=A0A8J7FJ78_9NEIS|nr:ArsC family reductase [Chitinilyticum piscinae]MBE9608837.1 ArsC family reductase [Chitinilyticum piscinae]
MLHLYGISNCDTVKKAKRWLDERQVAYHWHDFKKSEISAAQLHDWAALCGWGTLLNRKGTTWKKLPLVEQAAICDTASACAAMATYSSLIKRPVLLLADGDIIVGFSEHLYQQRLGSTVSP